MLFHEQFEKTEEMKSILFILLFSITLVSQAQKGFIRGSVFDAETGESLVGVTVLIKGTTTGTTTDLDGKFSIEMPLGTYDIQISYISYQTLSIEKVQVKNGEVSLLNDLKLQTSSMQLQTVVVTAQSIRTTESALQTMKKKSVTMIDGISSSKFQLIGDATAVEAAKRVTGVSVEGGKYVYIRGLGDRYTKTTLNAMEIPGLDPDRNTLQMDIFPSNLIDNIVVRKNFTAEMPADFTGGLLNVETKDFPEDKTFNVSIGASFTPGMHFNDDYLTYEGGKTDYLGMDDGTRDLPDNADLEDIPTPVTHFNQPDAINSFVKSFNSQLGAQREQSFMDYSLGISLGNQIELKTKNENKPKLGFIFSLSYKTDITYYDDIVYGEYQHNQDPTEYEMIYATTKTGELGKSNVLIGTLGGIAFKTKFTKIRLTAMHLQNGESSAAKLFIDNNGAAASQSGYIGSSNNLEYNERSLSNILLNGTHLFGNNNWEIDWRLSPTISTSDDPDIRKTAFTYYDDDTVFDAGAAGNPSRIWRSLYETNIAAKMDITKKYKLFNEEAKVKFGISQTNKNREYEILAFDMQFWGEQRWKNSDPNEILNPDNIYPNTPNGVYYQSGNTTPNSNAYESNSTNTGFYISNEFELFTNLKTIAGLRAENFVQRHTGRDQAWANGDYKNGHSFDNDIVLESFDFFPSINFIYALTEEQNLRASFTKTIARPSFKELSYAQIIDPISNRIFNGGFYIYDDWDGKMVETRINNIDLRWEIFLKNSQTFSVSAFYKTFDKPIELVRIPEQKTSTEYQPRNVGDGLLYGMEFEFRKDFGFIMPSWDKLSISGNFTITESQIKMTTSEYDSRVAFQKNGEKIKKTRQMGGQAPYLINTGITYTNNDKGIASGLFYNVKGETLSIVGGDVFPDVYDTPFHSVNFSANKQLGKDKRFKIDFKVANVLGEKIETVYKAYKAKDQIYESKNPGRAFSLGLSYKL